jgi:AcrR family transcriptional regulator
VGPEPAFQRLPRAVREQQILDAAVEVFSRRGYHQANVDEIAEVAGISKPMVYAYLGAKEDLFIACLHREGARLMEAIAAAAGPDLGPDEQLWRGLRAFFSFVAAHRDGWSVLYRQARGQEPFASVLGRMRAHLASTVTNLFDRAAVDEPIGPGGSRGSAEDRSTLGYVVVGAAEALADRLVDHTALTADAAATQLMNVVWGGAGSMLRGQRWR